MNEQLFCPPLRKPATYKIAKLGLILALCAGSAFAQLPQAQPATSSQPTPVSLPHLYWHFLVHQNDLDNMAAKVQAKGRDGNPLRNVLQSRLGFSDADYTPIRTSSQRLASELQALNAQMKAMQPSPSNGPQFKALVAQRESYINNEVYNLSLELSPQNKAALESFMAQFFAPKRLTLKIPAPAGQTAGSGVSK